MEHSKKIFQIETLWLLNRLESYRILQKTAKNTKVAFLLLIFKDKHTTKYTNEFGIDRNFSWNR